MFKFDTLVRVATNKKIWYQADFAIYREDYKPTPFGVRLKDNFLNAEITYWEYCEVVKSVR